MKSTDQIERDLVNYIMGLWHQRRIQKYIAAKPEDITTSKFTLKRDSNGATYLTRKES
jgi:hypothetical protein